MLKKKKIFIAIVVLVMMVAMAVTAYAASKSCTLHASTTGDVNSNSITATVSHYAGYNYLSSTDNMMARYQIYASGWSKLTDVRLAPGDYFASTPSLHVNPAQNFRVKIYSEHGNGGVEGVGTVYDY